jgi:colicin import membrane protein
MSTAIVEYSATEAALADLAQRYKDVVFDVKTTAGMQVAKKGRAEIRQYRTALEAKRVEIKAPALERSRLIDAEARRITAELLALETPIDDLIKAEETRKEREKAERERKELERIERIQTAIAKVGADAAAMAGKPSGEIATALETVRAMWEAGEWAGEFQAQAQAAKEAAVATLTDLHEAAIAREAEQARIKAERAELARLRAEQAQRARDEQARIAEETRQRAEAEAAARAKIEAEERAARERIEAEERKARQEREAEDRKAREAIEAEQREARRKQAEEDARLKAERERVEAERRAVEERERKAREAEEAKQSEIDRQQNELLNARAMLQAFRTRFGHRKEFAAVVKAIDALAQSGSKKIETAKDAA